MQQNDAPILNQSVRWGENYVSRGLNMKLAGIIPAGIYHGFEVRPGGEMSVLIDHESDYPKSVAVVERDGYSLTVTMEDHGLVKIPAPGKWFICIEAHYAPTKQGYQRVVAREKVESHHIILATVIVPEAERIIDQAMIDYADRQYFQQIPEIISSLQSQLFQNFTSIIRLLDRLTKESLKRIELKNSLYFSHEREAANARILVTALDRITSLELAFYSGTISGAGLSELQGHISPAGYKSYSGAIVAPVSIAPDGTNAPMGAALILKIDEV